MTEYLYNKLIETIEKLGYAKEFGFLIAQNLGSDKAIQRMISYLQSDEPKVEETIVDEMLAIMEDHRRWKEKILSENANANYNEYLNSGLRGDE